MGIGYSDTANQGLRDTTIPQKPSQPTSTEHSFKTLIRIKCEGERLVFVASGNEHMNPFKNLVSPKDINQRVVILGLYVTYVQNEFEHNLSPKIAGLFEASNKNQDVATTDDTGSVLIYCPAQHNAEIKGNDRILYRPRLKEDTIRAYAAVGKCIAETTIRTESAKMLFAKEHPLILYMIKEQEVLGVTSENVVCIPESGLYSVPTDVAKRVKEHFVNTIYEDIHETRFEDTQMTCDAPQKALEEHKSLSVLLHMQYLLIQQQGN